MLNDINPAKLRDESAAEDQALELLRDRATCNILDPNTLIVSSKKPSHHSLQWIRGISSTLGCRDHGGCLGAVRNQRPLWGVWRAGANSVTEIHP